MNKTQPNHLRIVALAPSTKGVGFAALEGSDMLVDWGVKSVQTGDKNRQSLNRVKELIAQYRPDVLVLEDVKGSRRSQRIQKLNQQIVKLAQKLKVSVKLYSRDQVMKAFIPEGGGTKHRLAEIIAERFTEQLSKQLPPKRKPWMSEDSRMNIFEAVALALMLRL
jgi:Holliday junction resolvasome RuvABC endonuclease subunit